MILYLDSNSFAPAIVSFTLSIFSSLLDRMLALCIASSPQVHHKLLYLLRRTYNFTTSLSLVHLSDHYLQLDNPALIDLAEEINPGRVVPFEGGDGCSVLDLYDVVIAEHIVARQRAVNEVHSIGDANAT